MLEYIFTIGPDIEHLINALWHLDKTGYLGFGLITDLVVENNGSVDELVRKLKFVPYQLREWAVVENDVIRSVEEFDKNMFWRKVQRYTPRYPGAISNTIINIPNDTIQSLMGASDLSSAWRVGFVFENYDAAALMHETLRDWGTSIIECFVVCNVNTTDVAWLTKKLFENEDEEVESINIFLSHVAYCGSLERLTFIPYNISSIGSPLASNQTIQLLQSLGFDFRIHSMVSIMLPRAFGELARVITRIKDMNLTFDLQSLPTQLVNTANPIENVELLIS